MANRQKQQEHAASALPGLLKPATVAKLLSCSRKTVYRLIESGKLQAVDFGDGNLRVETAEYTRYVASLPRKRKRRAA